MNKSKEKRSVSQLEKWNWKGEIPTEENPSYEEYAFYLLRHKPIQEYDAEDVYFMIGQERILEYVVPIAIDYLLSSVIIQAEDYPGDLFKRVLQIEKSFWKKFPDYFKAVSELIKKEESLFPHDELSHDTNKLIKSSIKSFLGNE